ncbi:TPA: hypothetical protein OZS91_004290 [Escherichia coli]|nr:hypothetical protein [Escherichia coli]
MKETINTVLLITLILITRASFAISSGAQVQTITGITYDHSGSSTSVPGQWVKVGSLTNIAMYSSVGSFSLCASSPLCAWSIVNIGRGGVSWTKPSVYFFSPNVTLSGSDDASQYTFQFALTFPSPPVIGLTSENMNNGREWNQTIEVSDNYPQDPENAAMTWQSSSDINLGGWCGNALGCDWSETTYLHTTSSKPYLWVKIPANLKNQSYSFNRVKLMSVQHVERNNSGTTQVRSQEAALYVSGVITLPQRCYSNLNASTLNFGDIKTTAAAGLLSSRSVEMVTECYYIPENVKQYITISPANGLAVNNEQSLAYFTDDNSSSPALGFTFNINNMPNCQTTSSGNKRFNTDTLIRTVSSGIKATYTDNIEFSLCKYGIPSFTGNKSVTLNIVTRWERPS